jgi:hypothetical protein
MKKTDPVHSENSFLVSSGSLNTGLSESLFEPVRDFSDSTFYDTSTWVLPMAFNIDYAGVSLPKKWMAYRRRDYHAGEIKGRLISGKKPICLPV